MTYDPIKDEIKQYSLTEWQKEVKESIDEYVKTFNGKNDFHNKPHSFDIWMNSFNRYNSW